MKPITTAILFAMTLAILPAAHAPEPLAPISGHDRAALIEQLRDYGTLAELFADFTILPDFQRGRFIGAAHGYREAADLLASFQPQASVAQSREPEPLEPLEQRGRHLTP